MKLAKFNEDQALIIQVIEKSGEEDVENLAERLRFDRRRLLNILQNMQHKGLIKIKNTGYGVVATLSSKGHKTAHLLWPELPYVQYS